MTVTLSIIVPVYKVEKYLDCCIESILNQPFKDFELILIDDGSPDHCGTMCDQWAQRDERIKVIHQSNQGLSAARNSGLAIIQGRYLCFIDSDDTISDDFFTPNIEWLDQHPNVDMLRLNIQSINEKSQRQQTMVEQREWRILTDLHDIRNTIFSNDTIGVWQSIYRAKVWQSMRFPVGMFHEDDYIKPELSTIVHTIALSPHGTYLYLLREGSITGTRLTSKRLNDIIQVNKHTINHLAQVDRNLYYDKRYEWIIYTSQLTQQCQPSDRDTLIKSFQNYPVRFGELLTLRSISVKVRILSALSRLLPMGLLLRVIHLIRKK